MMRITKSNPVVDTRGENDQIEMSLPAGGGDPVILRKKAADRGCRPRLSRLRFAAQRGLAVLVFFVFVSPLVACPMCKDSAVETNSKTTVADTAGLDFNRSIYAMLGGLGIITGITGNVIFKAARSA